MFIAIGAVSQRAFYSYDGINWANATNMVGIVYGITYGKDKFVACKIDNPGFRINISYDGKNWQGVSTPSTMDLSWISVTYANDRYVAVAESTVSGSIAISYDGITWNNVTRPLAGTTTTYNICYGKGLFVITCNQGKILTSPDGINWTARDTPLTGLIWKCIFAEGIFIAAGAFSSTQNRFIYSTDGITWQEASTPALNDWGGFAYGNGLLLAVTYNGTDSSALVVSSGVMNSFVTQNDNITHGRQTFTDDVILSGSLNVTGSQNITGPLNVTGSLLVTGNITAQTLVVQTITSSVLYSSGSNIFGNSLTNTQQFTGSVTVTGSSVSFNGSSGFNWDGVNNRLGIGTSTPGYALDITENLATPAQVGIRTANGFVNMTYGTMIANVEFSGWKGGSFGNENAAIQVYYNGDGTNRKGKMHLLVAESNFLGGPNITLSQTTTNNKITITGHGGSTYNDTIVSPSLTTTYAQHANTIINGDGGIPILSIDRLGVVQSVVFANGNFSIGSTTDTGERFQVSGSSRFNGNVLISGSANTSATNALTVQNSDAVNLFRVRNDRTVIVGTDGLSFTISTSNVSIDRLPFNVLNDGASSNFTVSSIIGGRGGVEIHNIVNTAMTVNPTAGSAQYRMYNVSPTINQTGGANGITRGLYVNPTLTAAADFRAIEWSNNSVTAPSASWGLYGAGTAPNYINGNLLVGTTSDSGEKLNVGGTMKVTGASTFNGNINLTRTVNATTEILISNTTSGANSSAGFTLTSSGGSAYIAKYSDTTTTFKILTANTVYLANYTSGNIAILNNATSGEILLAAGGSSTAHMTIKSNGRINMSSLPTSATGLSTGDLWNDAGTVKIA
jgi:IMP dehydrogenase/GMP reductase